MEADSHYTVSGVERFLYTVSVMNININVQDTIMISAKAVFISCQCASIFEF